MKPLQICIDARLVSGTAGGLEPVISGLAHGLSNLVDGEEMYFFLTYPGSDEWLKPNVKEPCQILYCPIHIQQRLKLWISRISPVIRRDIWLKVNRLVGWQRYGKLPLSNGTIEKSGIDLMHFTRQDAFLTDVPYIFHPHDLLHVHFPQFLSQYEFKEREYRYQGFCNQAQMVAVTSSWGKHDLIHHFNLTDEKVQVVPWAPAQLAYDNPSQTDLAALKRKYSLPGEFILYPAQTWPHKNHVRLLEAISILRTRHGITIPIVFSGRLTEYYSKINHRALELDIAEQVWPLGYINSAELRCLYALCRCVIIPTLFEAASGPLWEAFVTGAPAACSNVTSLPQQAGDAALIFNPYNPEEIANAIRILWTNDTLRKELVTLGKRNVSRFNWERTARHFRAHYRRIANRPLTEEDRMILNSPPLL